MAHPGGRPKEYDRLKIGDDFIKWAKENPDCLTVPHFATSIGLNSQILVNWTLVDEEFRVKYLEAKEIIGLNRLRATRQADETEVKRLDKSIYLQTLWHFDFDARNSNREEKQFDADLSKQSQNMVAAEFTKSVDALTTQISSWHSDLNKDNINSNAETKS